MVLSNDLSRPPAFLFLVEGVVALITGLAFWLLHRAIVQKEKYLLGRLAIANTAFDRARTLFAGSTAGTDEFDAFGKSAEDLVQLLEEYKAKFERQTKLDQLALTITGDASVRESKEYRIHPDIVKELEVGQCVFSIKSNKTLAVVKVPLQPPPMVKIPIHRPALDFKPIPQKETPLTGES